MPSLWLTFSATPRIHSEDAHNTVLQAATPATPHAAVKHRYNLETIPGLNNLLQPSGIAQQLPEVTLNVLETRKCEKELPTKPGHDTTRLAERSGTRSLRVEQTILP